MPNPTNIWGTYGDDSGGAGTGGPTPSEPDPAGTYAQCNDVVPDAPADDTRTLWAPVKSCGGTTPSVEWLPIDDATYPVGTVFRITDLTGGDLSGEQCAFVSDDYSLSELVPDTNFPSTGSVICSGYPDCDECNATCYKITDCLTAAVTYSNSVALAGVTGFQSVINGRCYTVAVESDKSNCCPETDTDVTPSGTYASCLACDEAINPDVQPDCPGSFWAVKFEDIVTCSCNPDGAGGAYSIGSIPSVWVCMDVGVEDEIDFGPEAYPSTWAVATHYDDVSCTTATDATGLSINMLSASGMVSIELNIPVNGGPGATVFTSAPATAPGVGGEVTLANTITSCTGSAGHSGTVTIRKLM